MSTDIDIIVEPGTDVESFIQKAGQIFPFKSQEEDVRKGRNNIEKRHYEFTYDSPINDKPLVILLDILFEENHYQTLLEKPIKNDLLLTDGEDLTVRIPDVNSILGDKLSFKGARGINYLRKVNLDCYAYVAAAVRLLGDEVEEVVYSFEGYAGEK